MATLYVPIIINCGNQYTGVDTELMEMKEVIEQAIQTLKVDIIKGKTEIYNEASVQYEHAIILRKILGKGHNIFLERNIDYFKLEKREFTKNEMDISIIEMSSSNKHCIGLKFPL